MNWVNGMLFGVLSEERAPSSVVVPEPGVLPSPRERGPSSAFGPDPKAPPTPCWGVDGLEVWSWGGGGILED